MPRGLKPTSSIITVSGDITGEVAGVHGQVQMDLSLNPLDNEVFVVVACSLSPDMINPALSTIFVNENEMALTSTRFAYMPDESDTNCFAYSRLTVYSDGANKGTAAIETNALDVPPASLDYVAIIATSNFWVSTSQNHSPAIVYPKNTFRVWGYRAIADSATYAALTQSQLLSA